MRCYRLVGRSCTRSGGSVGGARHGRGMARTTIAAAAAAIGVLGGATWHAGAREASRAATGPRTPPTAAAALRAEIEAKAAGRWRLAWSTLYPPHQRVAARETFVRCETETPFPARLVSLRVVRTAPATVAVAGLAHTMPGVAVTVDVQLRTPGAAPFGFRHTFHLVRAGSRWRWLLSPGRYRLYARHRCGEAPAL